MDKSPNPRTEQSEVRIFTRGRAIPKLAHLAPAPEAVSAKPRKPAVDPLNQD